MKQKAATRWSVTADCERVCSILFIGLRGYLNNPGSANRYFIIKRFGVADHHLADGRGEFDMVGQLATEQRKQAVGMNDCAA